MGDDSVVQKPDRNGVRILLRRMPVDIVASRKLAAAVAATFLVGACGNSERDGRESKCAPGTVTAPATRDGVQTISIPSQLSPEQHEAATRARDALLAACAATPIAWDEFREVSLSTGNAIGHLKDQLDWELVVTVALTYRDGLDRDRSGQRITFDMGAGRRPGIVTRKAAGVRLCGFEQRAVGVSSGAPCDPMAGEDCILDVPELKALDAARPPAVVANDRTAPPAWCFGHGVDPPPFWTCTSTESACKKARAAEKREENGDYRVRTGCDRTETLHCFVVDGGKTVCAPNGDACVTSRKEWTNNSTSTACEVASAAMLQASGVRD